MRPACMCAVCDAGKSCAVGTTCARRVATRAVAKHARMLRSRSGIVRVAVPLCIPRLPAVKSRPCVRTRARGRHDRAVTWMYRRTLATPIQSRVRRVWRCWRRSCVPVGPRRGTMSTATSRATCRAAARAMRLSNAVFINVPSRATVILIAPSWWTAVVARVASRCQSVAIHASSRAIRTWPRARKMSYAAIASPSHASAVVNRSRPPVACSTVSPPLSIRRLRATRRVPRSCARSSLLRLLASSIRRGKIRR